MPHDIGLSNSTLPHCRWCAVIMMCRN